MATKTITSGENATPVGASGTKLYTRTRTTYTLGENGKIDPNSVKQEILYSQIPGDPPVIAATRTGTSKDFTFNKNEFTGQFYFGADAQKSLKQGALKTTTNQQIQTSTRKEGLTPEQQKIISNNLNVASTSPSQDQQQGAGLTTEQITELNKQIDPKNIKARGKYDSVVYPIGLNPQHQDCIKFSIVEYKSSGLRGFGESAAGSRRVDVISGIPGFTDKGAREILATITLPIPGGIQDSNTVNWSGMTMGPLEQAFGSVIASELAQGKGTEQLSDQAQQAMKDKEGLRQGIISKFVQGAVGGSGIMQRLSGDIINPNLELLFNSPDLRTFSFSFKLSPRSSLEAERVKKIIRTFKQAMSVKRRESSFLLQSPNTFAISYIFKNKNHPYLNKFKECALTSCNVNYTPEGNYMSFDDPNHPSMVSYQLDLSFQELEPIYNDDYGTSEKDYDNIGF